VENPERLYELVAIAPVLVIGAGVKSMMSAGTTGAGRR
jgi:hypothetical protein